MHMILLVLTNEDTPEKGYESAIEFCDELVQGDRGYDYYTPLHKEKYRKWGTFFNQRKTFDINSDKLYKGNKTVQSELDRLIKVGQKEFLEWVKKANDSLNDPEKDFYDYYYYLHLATLPETFHVFDATGWSGGGPITNVEYLDKITNYMMKNYKDKTTFVTGFDVHF